MNKILSRCGRISSDIPFVVFVPDEIEGDIEFAFKLIENRNHSYTTYNVLSEHKGEIVISNVKDRGVSSQPILVGTYKGAYKLYVSFVVFSEDDGWGIRVEFIAKENKGKMLRNLQKYL